MSAVQRVSLQPAYLLHQRAYRDTSMILDVLTPEFGRIALVAKGVRQQKSKLKGVLRLFQPLVISWTSRGEMGSLTGAEAQGRSLHMAPEVLPCGFYLNELVLKLLHQHDPQIELFSDYDETLRRLAAISIEHATLTQAQQQKSIEVCLRHFEVSLLQAMGYALNIDRDFHTHSTISSNSEYLYHFDAGPSLLSAHSESGAVEAGIAINGAALLALSSRSLSLEHPDIIFQQAKRLMRAILDYYLGHKPLHSRQLLMGQRKMPGDIPEVQDD